MADGVQVTFSAQIGQLISGVQEVKGQLASIGDTVGGVSDGFKQLGELIGVSLGAHELVEFAKSMAEVGEQTEITARILGTSTDEVGRLDAIAKGSGTTVEALSKGFEVFQANLQKAQNATSPAAQALHALGLSAKEFIGLPYDQQLAKFADATAKFADGGAKLAAVRALWGRLGDDLIGTFDEGSAGLNNLAEMADRAGTALDEKTTKAFVATKLGMTELSLSIEGVGIRAFKLLEPAIDDAVKTLTQFFEKDLDANNINNIFKTVGNALIGIAEELATFFVKAGGSVDEFKVKLDDLWASFTPSVTLTGPAATAFRAVFDSSYKTIADLRRDFAKPIIFGTPELPKSVADVSAQLADIKSKADAARKALADAIAGASGQFGPPKPEEKKPEVPNFGGAADATKAVAEQYSEQEKLAQENYATTLKLADQAFAQTKEHLTAEAKLHEITYGEETAQLIAALDRQRAAEQQAVDTEAAAVNAALTAKIALYAKGTEEWQKAVDAQAEANKKALDKQAVDDAEYQARRRKIVDDGAKEEEQAYKAAADQIASAVNSQLLNVLQGHETMAQAIKKISEDLALKLIEAADKAALEFIASKTREVVADLTGETAKRAAHVASESAQTAATTAGVTARTAAQATADSGNILDTIANALKAIFAGAGQTAAGVAANVAPEAGPAAPAIGLAAGTEVAALAGDMVVGSYAVGTDYVLRGGLAMIHEGEKIIPAQTSGPYTGKGEGGADTSRMVRGLLADHRAENAAMHAESRKTTRGLWSAVDALHATIKKNR